MNIILPAVYRGNIDINITAHRLTLLTDSPSLNLASIKRNLHRHYNNGLTKYLKNLRLSIVTDLKTCKKIWQQLSPNENLFDLWDVRLAFHQSYGGQPYFMTLTKNSHLLACLPLFYQNTIKKYTWFGSDWMENINFFTADPYFLPILLYFAPKPLVLEGISQKSARLLPEFIKLEQDLPNFALDLTRLMTMDHYLSTLPKKKRYNFRRDYRKILELQPVVTFDDFDQFEKMITITKKRFHDKGEETDVEKDPFIEGAFYNLLHAGSSQFEAKLQTVTINGRTAAIDMLAFHNGVVYPMRGGNDIPNFPGIGNFINYHEINQAFAMGLKKIDYLQIGYGWKQRYLTTEPRFKIELTK